MSKKNKADNTIKADGPQTTEDENNAAALGVPVEPAYRGEIEGREYTMQEIAALAEESDAENGGHEVTIIDARDRKAIAAEWLEQKMRVECEQAKLDSLADELGRDIAADGKARHPIRIGGGLYRAHKARDTKTYTLVEYVAPKTIEAL